MSLWDDLQKFGGGLIEDVGEGVDSLIDGWVDDQTGNAATTQQPNTPQSDRYGNKRVVDYTPPTAPLSAYLTPKNVAMVGGGVLLLVVAVMTTKQLVDFD